jgi:xanthine dehydrogenase molybdopterin-binding subunit B
VLQQQFNEFLALAGDVINQRRDFALFVQERRVDGRFVGQEQFEQLFAAVVALNGQRERRLLLFIDQIGVQSVAEKELA